VALIVKSMKNERSEQREARKPIDQFLGWSMEPRRGVLSHVATRLKLIYWFARFSLFRPLILHALHDQSHELPFVGWALVQEGLRAAFTMLKIAVMEDMDIDVIIGNKLISVCSLLRSVVNKTSFPGVCNESESDILQDCVEMLWHWLANKSEWIACRLHAL